MFYTAFVAVVFLLQFFILNWMCLLSKTFCSDLAFRFWNFAVLISLFRNFAVVVLFYVHGKQVWSWWIGAVIYVFSKYVK